MNGCRLLFGYRTIEAFDKASYDRFIEKVMADTIPAMSIISTENQFALYRSLSQDSLWRESFSGQPVQILYFYKDSLVSYHINCLAEGKIFGLNWNTDGRFLSFPPQSAIPTNKVGISFNDIRNTFDLGNIDKNYSIVVFWSNMLSKVSKSAVEMVKENMNQYRDPKNAELILINTDNYYVAKMTE